MPSFGLPRGARLALRRRLRPPLEGALRGLRRLRRKPLLLLQDGPPRLPLAHARPSPAPIPASGFAASMPPPPGNPSGPPSPPVPTAGPDRPAFARFIQNISAAVPPRVSDHCREHAARQPCGFAGLRPETRGRTARLNAELRELGSTAEEPDSGSDLQERKELEMNRLTRIGFAFLVLVMVLAAFRRRPRLRSGFFRPASTALPRRFARAGDSAPFGGSYFIPDFRLASIWVVPTLGRAATAFSCAIGSSEAGGAVPTSGWGANSGKITCSPAAIS